MDYAKWRSLPELFFAQAAKFGDKPFLFAKDRQDGQWHGRSWQATAQQIRLMARGLQNMGVKPGDRVALVAENRPEWLISDLAIMTAGGITVPTFTTNTVADHKHILTNSGAVGAIISNKTIAKRLLPAAMEAPDLRFVVAMDTLDIAQSPIVPIHPWDDVMMKGEYAADRLDETLATLKRDGVSCFIYTSGTGGVPKGVMLTHGSILCNCMGAHDLLASFNLGQEIFLSFLPLSHSYEHTAGQFFPIAIGAQIYYAESVEKLVDNLSEVRPTIMTAVPRLYEMMHQRILRAIEKAKPFQRRLFFKTLELGNRRYENPGSLSLRDRLTDFLCEKLVRRKMRRRFGGRLKAFVSGGAALNYEIGLFFTALGVRLLQGYGQTECSPVISANPPGRIRLKTVGPALKGVEIKIAEDGEILVRSEAVMKGYWRDEEATAAALRDGWLHTGDIGELDADRYLTITDRKKDIIVLSGGDNVSPARVEGFLILQPEINQAMVFGDRQSHLVALLVPDQEFVKDWAERNSRTADLTLLAEDPEFAKSLAPAVDRVNQIMSSIERIRRFIIAAEPFTIENAMLTPSLKIRRHKIRDVYGPALLALYD